jgi:hypothetical protein
MTNKRMRLPREGVIEPEQPSKPSTPGAPDSEDVEGHGFANPAPPSDFVPRSPSQGGDIVPTEEDV